MTPDIHPHWTNTESPEEEQTPVGQDIRGSVQGRRVPINQHKRYLNFLAAATGVSALLIVFVQGVSFLQANLTDQGVQIAITADGFAEMTVEVGDSVVFENTGSSPEQMRTSQRGSDGAALVELPLLSPGETYEWEVENALAGRRLTFVSAFLPTRQGVIIVENIPEEPEVMEEPEIEEESVPASEPEVMEAVPTSSMPEIHLGQTEVAPQPASNAPVINLNQAPTVQTSTWPNAMRVNRFTVESGLIPFSPTDQMPVHTVRQVSEQIHAAAGIDPRITRQPQTGPTLWALLWVSLCALPFFVKQRA